MLYKTQADCVVEFARAHGLVSMIDNTFASPVNFRPPEIGFDLSIHSCQTFVRIGCVSGELLVACLFNDRFSTSSSCGCSAPSIGKPPSIPSLVHSGVAR